MVMAWRFFSHPCTSNGAGAKLIARSVAQSTVAKVCWQLRSVFVEDLATNIRPEFFHFIGNAIPHQQHAERPGVAPEGAIVRGMIDVGESCGGSVAGNFRIIEAQMSGIRARDEKSIDGVVGAVSERAFAHLVVARILVQYGGKYGGGHIRANSVVGKRSSISLSVGSPALAPGLR